MLSHKTGILLTLAVLLLSCAVGCGGKSESKPEAVPKPREKKTAGKQQVQLKPKAKPKPQTDESRFVFADVARERGVDFKYFADQVSGRFFIVESMGATMAWFDYDLNGTQDLYLLDGNVLAEPTEKYKNRLYRNTDARFEQIDESGTEDTGYAFGVAVGDFDVDGFPDLYVTNYGPNTLLHNNGDGTFSEVTGDLLADKRWGTGCVWFDANGDRLPDLYVSNYGNVTIETSKVCKYNGLPGYCGPNQFPAEDDLVLLNRGDGSFDDVTKSLGFNTQPAYSLGLLVADLNDDAQPELVVARDLTPNCLFVREDGTWTDQAEAAGVSAAGDGKIEAGMGIACADFDGDQQFDFMLTHYFEAKNTLYRNLGDFVFADDSFRSGVAGATLPFLGFGTNVLDVNRDSAPDIFITNGHVLGENHAPNEMTGQILLNNGRGRFKDVSSRCGPYFERELLGRGSATADFDNDGDLDIAVGHLDARFSLLEDQNANPSWIGLDVVPLDRAGVAGGKVVVECGDIQRHIPLTHGASYLSVSDSRLLVALPEGTESVNVTVVWPGGETRVISDLARNQYWRVGKETHEPVVW